MSSCCDQIVLKGSRSSTEQTIDLIKFRIVWWFKHFKKGSHESVTTILLNLKDLCVETKKQKYYHIKDWIPPAIDSFKFNVDGSSRSNSGPIGIGGVLRDSKGLVMCLFTQSVGIMNSNSVVILAIKRALELCFTKLNLHNRDIIISSDSRSTISWVNG
ncbi:hypothetical protein Dsin_006062 [Dipteronia sinensis]|uniref:RNase H type-1 domain-containing protein n=1 Tax=Dipteronia sinensis TaxID=43782 RepID=A0AAE0AYU2_9ROSI|nr:hypothetical protein Dsin_006062 [Dipteronia sinensis]